MSSRKTKVVITGFLLLVLLCGGALIYWITPHHNTLTQASPPTSGTHTEASWAFPAVRWHEHNYIVTPKAVQPDQIGKLIGTVTNSSNEETADESGTFSNFLPVGTKLYELAGTSSDQFLVVEQEKGHFVEASAR